MCPTDESAAVQGHGIPAIVLTAERAAERWQRMEERLQEYNAQFIRFSSLDGTQRNSSMAQVGRLACVVVERPCELCCECMMTLRKLVGLAAAIALLTRGESAK